MHHFRKKIIQYFVDEVSLNNNKMNKDKKGSIQFKKKMSIFIESFF